MTNKCFLCDLPLGEGKDCPNCELFKKIADRPVKPVEGQCGTCAFAKSFGYAGSPSGPEDGVKCISLVHAKWIDKQGGFHPDEEGHGQFQAEFNKYGYLDLFRLEVLEGPEYRCPHWGPKV